MGTITRRERMLRAIRFEETDIVPYNIQMKPEIRQQLVEYFGQTDLEQWMGNHSIYLIGPEWIQKDLGENRIVIYCGSVIQDPDNPSIGILRVVEPALPHPTLRGFQFPDPGKVKLESYSAGQDGLLMGLSIGCMEVASYMRGFARAWMDFVEYPAFLHELMDGITEFVMGMMDRVSSYELDGFHIGDDWGSQRGLLISPRHWRAFIKPRMAKLVQHAKAYGGLFRSTATGTSAKSWMT